MSQSVLILSNHPPSSSNVAGLSTAGFLPALEKRLVFCAAICPLTTPEIDPFVPNDHLLLLKKRYETGWRYGPRGLNSVFGHLAFRAKLIPLAHSYRKRIVDWARQHKPEKLWAVTSSITVILVAKRIANELKIPIYTHILDIPEQECSRLNLDKWSTGLVMHEFKALLQASRKIAVVSDGMAEHYAFWANNNFVLMRHGVSSGHKAGSLQGKETVFRIGFSGSLYALDAWESLLSALDALHWQIGHKRIVMRMFGAKIPRLDSRPVNIEWMGWRNEQEVVSLLGDCDVGYLPYPFTPEWIDVVRTSFATKFSAYAAAGVPVLVHAPSESTVARFCIEHNCGLAVTSLNTGAVVGAIHQLQDTGRIKALKTGIKNVLEGPLSLAYNLTQFRKFLEMEDG